jgi:2-hydroxymuconate-semialdehyde hydrolase/2-hydroxy-6-oxo-octa-2,4-dienoate hydrolase
MTSSYSWRYVIGPLSERYRVYAPDLVGSGATDSPADLVYSVGNVARFVAAYVRQLAVEAPFLVGNSLGGLYCLKALLDKPELACRFVLSHAPGYPMPRLGAMHAMLAFPGAATATAWMFHRFADSIVARSVRYRRRDMMSREEVREYARPLRTLDGTRVFVRTLRESLDPAEHASIVAELRRTRPFPCPVLLLFARLDALVPPEFGPRFARDIPGSTLHWIDRSSHFTQVDQPVRTVAEIVGFDRR